MPSIAKGEIRFRWIRHAVVREFEVEPILAMERMRGPRQNLGAMPLHPSQLAAHLDNG